MAEDLYHCARCGDAMPEKFAGSHDVICSWLAVWGELLSETMGTKVEFRLGFPCHRCGIQEGGNPYEHAAMHRTLAALEQTEEETLGRLTEADFRWVPSERAIG
jgi:hypothetical protein